jgi:bifunctional non-homologous end joining protein LigD
MSARKATTRSKKAPDQATKPAARSRTRTSGLARPAASAQTDDQLSEYNRKRDFGKTAEPAGGAARARKRGELRFVIQKHAASHLHYDLRLEVDGVMKSWAVPKGPSADPSVKRLAMQVEDHPIEYNTFEGTIPEGEYGGGTVMLWDTGTYRVENAGDRSQNAAAHDQYERGDMKVDFHGKRITGSYALVRTRGMPGSRSGKPQWLLIKHRDERVLADGEQDLTDRFTTSVTTKRTMDQIRDDDS